MKAHLAAGKTSLADDLYLLVRQGNTEAREKLLEQHRLFIQRVACTACSRQLVWGHDDELSIALMAFNEAVDRYEVKRGVPFLAYTRTVIKSRLADYGRQERRRGPEIALDGGQEEGRRREGSPALDRQALERYAEDLVVRERAEELRRYEALLVEYGLGLADLEQASPSHRERRRRLVATARTLATTPDLFRYVEEKKMLPLQELVQETGLSRKTLERGRKYILGLCLLLGYPEEFTYLNDYLKD